MGKTSKKLSLQSKEGKNQRTIASFFQGRNVSTTGDSKSQLFEEIGQEKKRNKLTTSKVAVKQSSSSNNKNVCGSSRTTNDVIILPDTPKEKENDEQKARGRHKVGKNLQHAASSKAASVLNASSGVNHTTVQGSAKLARAKSDVGVASDKETRHDLRDGIISIPETQVTPCPNGRFTPDKAVNKPGKPDSDTDPDIIPDTPEQELLEKQKKMKRYNRSFLTSGSSLTNPVKKPPSKPSVKDKRRLNTANRKTSKMKDSGEKSDCKTSTLLCTDISTSDSANLALAMGGMGVTFPAEDAIGVSVSCAAVKSPVATTDWSGHGQRKRSISKGLSPNPKRSNTRKSPIKSAVACKKNLTVACEEITIDEDDETDNTCIEECSNEPRKPYHWGLKRKPLVTHSNKIMSNSSNTENDNVLSDILTELNKDNVCSSSGTSLGKKEHSSSISKLPDRNVKANNNVVPMVTDGDLSNNMAGESVGQKSDPGFAKLSDTCKDDNNSVVPMVTDGDVSDVVPMATEGSALLDDSVGDSALDEIMLELRQTLSQRKFTSPKPLSSTKPKPTKLNFGSTSRDTRRCSDMGQNMEMAALGSDVALGHKSTGRSLNSAGIVSSSLKSSMVGGSNTKLLCDNDNDPIEGVTVKESKDDKSPISSEQCKLVNEHDPSPSSDSLAEIKLPSSNLVKDNLDDTVDEMALLRAMEEHGQTSTSSDAEKDLCCQIQHLSPFKKPDASPSSEVEEATEAPPWSRFGRCTVLQVQHDANDVVLNVQAELDKSVKTVRLQGFWTDTCVAVGDIVNVVGDFNAEGECVICDKENFLVVHPDLLISGTSVVSGVHCMRRSVLNEKFKGCDSKNIYMLHGSIIHCFFQEVLQEKAFNKTAMEQVALRIVRQGKFLHDIYSHGVTEDSVLEEIHKYIPQTLSFVQKYVRSKQFSFGQKSNAGVDTTITDIADIEENVWCPRFGIKGKIDLTVEVKCQNKRGTQMLPLELKTGKPTYSIEHKGQVTLYAMMSGDRRADPGAGLLLYLREGTMKTIPADYANKRGLIQLRNELANYLKASITKNKSEVNDDWMFGFLPPPIDNHRTCSRCPQIVNCAAYQSMIEKRNLGDDHAITRLIPESLGHLAASHLKYFAHWCQLLHLELATSVKNGNLSATWCQTATKRESRGECLSGMALVQDGCLVVDKEKFLQTFTRHPSCNSKLPVCDVGVAKGDSVVISAEDQPLIALCTGFVDHVTSDSATVLVDRDLRRYLEQGATRYRIDKSDFFNTMGTNFTYLSRLMQDNVISGKLRELMIDRRPPEFQLTLSKTAVVKEIANKNSKFRNRFLNYLFNDTKPLYIVKSIFKTLNTPQKTAVLKVLMCLDYVLIKGYPGTGKTSTIVALVRVLAILGYSVLLASYTNSAVDNILLKLKTHNVDFIRVGRLARIHPDIKPYAAETLTKDITSVQQLSDFYNAKKVVASTCLGTTHAVFSRETFDICIVDEASQVLQCACLGPLFCANKFVLVGDPLQLAPVVQSNEARELGMDQSMFAQLDDIGATYELNLQYRMNSEIMRLSNELVYGGALKCGSKTVATNRLRLRHPEVLTEGSPVWVAEALSPEEGKEVTFLNTDKIPLVENLDKDAGVKSATEAEIVTRLTLTLVKAGVGDDDIGIIAPYRQQVRLVQERVQAVHGTSLIEVNTVDQYQGRDKSVIIVSFVKTSTHGRAVSNILKDIRRLNVAVTRAKHKLIMVGSIQTLKQYEPLAKVLNILHQEQFILQRMLLTQAERTSLHTLHATKLDADL